MADPKMIMQKAGVVLNDEKKWSKKSSPFAQFGVLVTEEQHASAIKMGDVAFKNMKGEKVARAYVRCMQANCHIKLEEYAKALEKAAQATVEGAGLANVGPSAAAAVVGTALRRAFGWLAPPAQRRCRGQTMRNRCRR